MKKTFGMIKDGREAFLYIIKNKNGMEIAVTNMGAALVEVKCQDKNGLERDLVLGYDSALEYEEGTESIGATVGRFANRVARGQFTIGEQTYQLTLNNGPNTLHGGRDFYVNRLWKTEEEKEDRVTFSLSSPDGDQGFPGNVQITVTYSLTDDNEVCITYTALSDADTPLNLTNHSYFNLGGQDSGSVLEQSLMLKASKITKTDEMSLPDGEYTTVAGTPMDFQQEKALGQDIEADYAPLHIGNGYDHNYMIDGEGFRQAGYLYCQETGLRMNIWTDLPGIQLYTANYLHVKGKGGIEYKPRTGVCFETQYYPDAINQKEFPGGMLKAGEFFTSKTIYQFEIVE